MHPHPRHPRGEALGLPTARGTRAKLDWAVFPLELVTGRLEEVSEATAIYHAIFTSNASAKALKLADALRRSRSSLPGCALLRRAARTGHGQSEGDPG